MSSYTSFIKSTTISADEMNNNFNYIGAGHWIPMSGATLTTDTTETLDIGSQTDRWNTMYCNNINIDGEVSNCFNMIAEVTLSATASAIEFDGLNGDMDEVYIIQCSIVATNTLNEVALILNNDSSTSNYGNQLLLGSGASPISQRNTTSLGLKQCYLALETTTSRRAFSESLLYAKTGHERTVIGESLNTASETYVSFNRIAGSIWNNTSDTITSMKFISDAGGNFSSNTNIQIWAKVSTITSRSITITET